MGELRQHILTRPTAWLALCLTAVVFVLDTQLPLGVAIATAYAPLQLFIIGWASRVQVIASSVALSGLTLAGFALSSAGGVFWMVLANRTLSLALIWSVALLGVMVIDRRNQIAQLLEKERLLAEIAANSDDAIISKDLAGNVMSWNQGASRMYGFTETEMLGAHINRIVPEDGQEELDEILSKLAAGEKVDHIETTRRTKSGDVLDVSLTVSPVLRSGVVVGAAAIGRDITPLKRAIAHLQEERRALESANAELESFSYSVSHDLRAPIRAIDGFARVLAEDHAHQLDADAQRVISIILTNTAKMGQLIDDLLEFSRLGRRALNQSVVNMSSLAEGAFKAATDAHDSTARLERGDLPNALGDPGLLQQVWLNLVENAVKYSAGAPEPKVKITARQDGDLVTYSVRDNGAGFDMRYVAKLFEPFERLHAGPEYDGTGIGLALVKRIVERHGGRVSAEGQVGSGATFSFSLPAAGQEGTHGDSPG